MRYLPGSASIVKTPLVSLRASKETYLDRTLASTPRFDRPTYHLPTKKQSSKPSTFTIYKEVTLYLRDWQQKTGHQNELSPHTCHLPRWRLPIPPLARWRLDLTVTPTDRPELCSQLVNHTFSSAQYLVGLDTGASTTGCVYGSMSTYAHAWPCCYLSQVKSTLSLYDCETG